MNQYILDTEEKKCDVVSQRRRSTPTQTNNIYIHISLNPCRKSRLTPNWKYNQSHPWKKNELTMPVKCEDTQYLMIIAMPSFFNVWIVLVFLAIRGCHRQIRSRHINRFVRVGPFDLHCGIHFPVRTFTRHRGEHRR
jgi:hypothetical protein